MTDIHRRKVLQAGLAAGAAAGGLWRAPALAQSMPDTARILLGFPGGSTLDVIARALAERLNGKLAKTVIVDNRPGAGGRIAAEVALQAPADGTTLLFNPGGILTVNPHVYKKLSYDPFRDFVPLSKLATFAFAFAVGPAVPAEVKNLAQFGAWVKANPSKGSYGSAAAGSPPHFVGHAIATHLGVDMTHVAYKGGGPAMNDLLGGQLTSVILTEGDFLATVRAGKVRLLAVSGSGRSRFYPEVPNLAEQGIKGLEQREWFGMYLAGKPPAEVVKRCSALVQAAVNTKEYVLALNNIGFEAASSSGPDLDREARSDLKRWEPMVKATGFQGD